MKAQPTYRGFTHGLLSASATGLFLCAGWVGYTALMHGTGGESRVARVLECRLVPPQSTEGRATISLPEGLAGFIEWGYALELSISLRHSNSLGDHETVWNGTNPVAETPLDRGIVRLQPRWSRRPALARLAGAFERGTPVRVRRSSNDPSRYEIVEARTGFDAFLPFLLSCLGVLCLALSLRFSSSGMQRLMEEEVSGDASTTHRPMRDFVHPRV